MTTVLDMYKQTIKPLEPADRLRLAALILNDLAAAADHEMTGLAGEEVRRFVKEHPAPQNWWDATDNPFEPEKAAGKRA